MSHLAIYRKFRPRIFDDVVGQSSVVQTIQNQIEHQTFGHAYLFTGIRGTGKTTIAKIFARSINCLSPNGTNPCNTCENCKSILNHSSMDIIEMDAASHNSVDDIREINENVKFPPSNAKFKVYIIDEVHMLSKGAFNALLKTLEEPPAYVVFVLATTEPNKIPDTILSRCQRYDLKRVSKKDVQKRIDQILETLEIDYEQSALDVIISKGEGSVRDSLSILDQCLSYSEDLSYDIVVRTLGLVEFSILKDFIEAIKEKDVAQGLNILHEIINEGKDINQFIASLLELFRKLMIFKMHKNPLDIIDDSKEHIDILKNQSSDFQLMFISRLINILIELEGQLKYSAQGQLLLEMAVIKMFSEEYSDSYEDLVLRIKSLEEKIESIEIKGLSQNIGVKSVTKEDHQPKINDEEKPSVKTKPAIKYDTADAIGEFIDQSSQVVIKISEIKSKWNEVLKILKKVKIQVYAFLIEAEPIKTNGSKIVLKLDEDYSFHGENLMKNKNKEIIQDILFKVYNKKLTIDVTYDAVELKEEKSENINVDEELNEYFSDFDKVLEIKE